MLLTHKRTGGLLALLGALAIVLGVGGAALADKVVTRDGRVLEGEIQEEREFFLVIVTKDGGRETILKANIESVERDGDAPAKGDAAPKTPADGDAKAVPQTPAAAPEARPAPVAGATKIAFVTLGDLRNGMDMVGPYMNTQALLKSVELLDALPEEQRPDILVLWIDSGGGYGMEQERLTEAIHHRIKPKYRTVAWIRSAISAAAMTAWACEEIYMMSNAPLGGCTGFYGSSGIAVAGKELAASLKQMEDVSRWGKQEPLVMRAMQICEPDFERNNLTADIDADGNVTWYDGDEGEYLVCRKDLILTLNALDAVKFGVARGIADTKEEVARMMGCSEWIEVGQVADKYQVQFREANKLAETKIDELYAKINIALNFAQGAQDEGERNAQVGRALGFLQQMRGIVRKAPSLAEFNGLSDRWFAEEAERIKSFRAR